MIESIFFNPWIWIFPIILLAMVGVVFVGIRCLIIDDLSMWVIGVVFGGIALLVGVPLYFGFVLPPYDASFYQTYRITGDVAQIESAFSGDEGTMSQVFIAKVDGVDLFIKSDDQRFRTIHEGDDVNLVCGKRFAYFQEPWFDCSIGGQR